MRVNRQRCQACGSRVLENLLVREAGQDQVVLVRCGRCRALVARYELNGYYHHGKGFESWLASYQGVYESGRELTERFKAVQTKAEEQFTRVLEQLRADGKDQAR